MVQEALSTGSFRPIFTVACPSHGYDFRPIRLSRVKQASLKVCLFDAHNYHSPYVNSPAYARLSFANLTGDGDRSNTYNYNDWEYGRGRLMGAWHDKHANLAFLDAHVERVHWSNPKSYGDDTFDDDDITYYAPYE